jgi:hypothetical protein
VSSLRTHRQAELLGQIGETSGGAMYAAGEDD